MRRWTNRLFGMPSKVKPLAMKGLTRNLSSGRVHSLYSFTTVDGPGVRYMVFLQGCLRRCAFCFNPDSWDPMGGTRMTVDEILSKVNDAKHFIKPNGGGITVSGGDPMMQPDFLAEIFERVHNELGVTTCVDTSGLGHEEGWDKVLPHTDLVLFCIKSATPKNYFHLTESTIDSAIKFSKHVAKYEVPMRIRHVLCPGLTDTPEETEALIKFAKAQPTLELIEVLPYHTLGVQKWGELGLKYRLDDYRSPTKEERESFIKKLNDEGLKTLME